MPFAIELIVIAPLALAGSSSNSVGAVVFLLPWILALFTVINLPFVATAVRAFQLDRATRRNHALEHATIYFLLASGKRRLSGKSVRDGFRVSGPASAPEIRKAFDRVRRVIRDGGRLPYVSPYCGSNLVTAQGLALVLLLGVTLIILLVQPPLIVRASALAFVVLFFLALRHRIGNWIQARFFMATDFEEVSLRDVREVPARPWERRPVHFVATIVRARASDSV